MVKMKIKIFKAKANYIRKAMLTWGKFVQKEKKVAKNKTSDELAKHYNVFFDNVQKIVKLVEKGLGEEVAKNIKMYSLKKKKRLSILHMKTKEYFIQNMTSTKKNKPDIYSKC